MYYSQHHTKFEKFVQICHASWKGILHIYVKKKKKLLFKNDMFYKVNVRDLTKKKVIPEFDQARKTLSLEHQLII